MLDFIVLLLFVQGNLCGLYKKIRYKFQKCILSWCKNLTQNDRIEGCNKNKEERENTGREITSACIKRGNKTFILHYRNAVSDLNTERLRLIKEQKQKTPLCYYIP